MSATSVGVTIRLYKAHLDELCRQHRARMFQIREKFDYEEKQRAAGYALDDLAGLKLTLAGMIQLMLRQGVFDEAELFAAVDPNGLERSEAMSAGAGFFDNYVKARDTLFDQVVRRRERMQKRVEEFEVGKEMVEMLLDDIGELKLVVASVLHLLVTKGVLSEDDLQAEAKIIDELDGKADGKLQGHIEPDGKIVPDEPRPRSSLDDLADAAREEEADGR